MPSKPLLIFKVPPSKTLSLSLSLDTTESVDLDDKSRTILLASLHWFNNHKQHIATLMSILNRQEGFSLRLIDWLTTNYSKRHKVVLAETTSHLPVDVYAEYRRHLNVYTKKYFDPFARRDRILLSTQEDGRTLSTTVGQINFMRWFLEKGVDTYIREYKTEIEHDMRTATTTNSHQEESAREGGLGQTCHIHVGSFTLDFDA